MPRAYERPSSFAFPLASWWTAMSAGVPCPFSNSRRTMWPGALGAISTTSTSSGGLIWP